MKFHERDDRILSSKALPGDVLHITRGKKSSNRKPLTATVYEMDTIGLPWGVIWLTRKVPVLYLVGTNGLPYALARRQLNDGYLLWAKMGGMSNQPTWPTPDPRPSDLQDAIEVLGDQMCADVLRFLWPRTSATTGTLMRGTGIKRPSLQKKLGLLEKKGCITVDVPPGDDRTGRNLNYSVDHARVLALLQAWVGYVFAQPSTAIPLPPPPFFGLGPADAGSAEG